jgi:hypothetical protein
MGDRCSVELFILNEQVEQFKTIVPDDEYEFGYGNEMHTCFFFYEVNYAELGYEHDLELNGIAYTKAWEAGDSYTPGESHLRFTPEGFTEITEFCVEFRNPDLAQLLDIIKLTADDAERGQLLTAHILNHQKNITPRSWENQITYGKIYRTRLLVGAPINDEIGTMP